MRNYLGTAYQEALGAPRALATQVVLIGFMVGGGFMLSPGGVLSGLRDPRPPHYLLHDHRRKCGSYAPLRPECVTGSVAIMPLCGTAC